MHCTEATAPRAPRCCLSPCFSLVLPFTTTSQVCIVIYVVAWDPLYLNGWYLGGDATTWEKAFAISGVTLFSLGIFTLIPLMVSLHIFMALIKLISTIKLESSLDRLHPQIELLGIDEFILRRANQVEQLAVQRVI